MNWALDRGTHQLDPKRAASVRGNDGSRAGKGGLCEGRQGAGGVRELGVHSKKGGRRLTARIYGGRRHIALGVLIQGSRGRPIAGSRTFVYVVPKDASRWWPFLL